MRVDLSPQERELTRLVAGHCAALNGLRQTSLAQALMSSPQALAAQLENMIAAAGPSSVACCCGRGSRLIGRDWRMSSASAR